MSAFPNDFNFDLYRLFYEDLRQFNNNELMIHYLDFGRNEGRIYKLPNDFNIKAYKELNKDLQHFNDNDSMIHYAHYGMKENRQYSFNKTIVNLPLSTSSSTNHQNLTSREHIVFVVARYNEDISNFMQFKDNLMIYNKGKDDINLNIDKKYIKNVPNLGREAGTYCNFILDNYDNLPDYMIMTQGNPCDHIAIFDPETTFKKLNEFFYEKKNYKFKYISGHKEPVDLDSLAHIGLGVYVTPIEMGNPKNINELIGDIQNWIRKNCPNQEVKSNEVVEKLRSFPSNTIWPWEFNIMLRGSGWYCTAGEGEIMRHYITKNCFDYSKIKWLFDRPEGFSFGYGAIFIVHRDNVLKYSRAYWQRLFDSLQELLPGAGWGCERLWGFLLGEGDFYPKR
jgi:hypothetical protein